KRAEEQERAASRLWRALWRARILTVIALCAAVVAALYAWEARRQTRLASRQAQLASSRALGMAAINKSQTDPELGTLLALHALEAANSLGDDATREAVDALGRTIAVARLRSSMPMTEPINKAAFSPDEKRLAVMLNDGTLQLFKWPQMLEETFL